MIIYRRRHSGRVQIAASLARLTESAQSVVSTAGASSSKWKKKS